MSKIEISKAIHNRSELYPITGDVVVSVSKIEISKAIHNPSLVRVPGTNVVVSVSKIEISKAIHNLLSANYFNGKLLSVCQR